jgi:hypothetical protein
VNGRLAKKLRKISRKSDTQIAIEFKAWVNGLPWQDRVRVAWRAIWRKM